MSTEISDRAKAMLDSRFLEQARQDGAEAQVDSELDDKIAHLKGGSEVISRMRELSRQAAGLWRERGSLSGKHLVYLTAGLLYFISPVDAVTDIIPVLGYVDDVAVLAWILSQIRPAAQKLKDSAIQLRDDTVEQATDRLVDKGRIALDEVVDQRTEDLIHRLDSAADEVLQRSVTAVVIGLWGTSTAAALSLAVSLLSGGYTQQWLAYIGITTLLVLAWNISVALIFLRRYRELDQRWQQALPRIIGARLARWKHVLAVGLPLLTLIGLAGAHLILH